jgi:hypothetical protein
VTVGDFVEIKPRARESHRECVCGLAEDDARRRRREDVDERNED